MGGIGAARRFARRGRGLACTEAAACWSAAAKGLQAARSRRRQTLAAVSSNGRRGGASRSVACSGALHSPGTRLVLAGSCCPGGRATAGRDSTACCLWNHTLLSPRSSLMRAAGEAGAESYGGRRPAEVEPGWPHLLGELAAISRAVTSSGHTSAARGGMLAPSAVERRSAAAQTAPGAARNCVNAHAACGGGQVLSLYSLFY